MVRSRCPVQIDGTNHRMWENPICNDERRASSLRGRKRVCPFDPARGSLGLAALDQYIDFDPFGKDALLREVLQETALLPLFRTSFLLPAFSYQFYPLHLDEKCSSMFSLLILLWPHAHHTQVSLTLSILSSELGSCLERSVKSQAHYDRWHIVYRWTGSTLWSL